MDNKTDKLFHDFIREGRFLRAWSPRTADIYQKAFDSFTRFQQSQRGCGASHPLPDTSASTTYLTKAQLGAWVVWMREQGLTAGGCNVHIRSINSFTSWLRTEGHMEQAGRVKPLRNPTKPPETFSEAEIRALMYFRPADRIQARAWALTLCLIDTGIRIDEALGLEQAKVNLDDLQMRVLGKGNKERIVPFSHEVRKHLYRLITKTPGRYVFQTHRGERLMYRNAYRDLKLVCALAGVEGKKVHPHNLRHFFAVTYIRRGGDIYRLSRILGHTSIATTQLYLRSMTSEQVGQAHCSPLTTSKPY